MIKPTRLNDGLDVKVERKREVKNDCTSPAQVTGKAELPLQSEEGSKEDKCGCPWRKKGNQELCFGQVRFEIVICIR